MVVHLGATRMHRHVAEVATIGLALSGPLAFSGRPVLKNAKVQPSMKWPPEHQAQVVDQLAAFSRCRCNCLLLASGVLPRSVKEGVVRFKKEALRASCCLDAD